MTADSERRLATAVAFALSFACVAIDAVAFLELGRTFTANPTGGRPGYGASLAGAAVAVSAFTAAVVAGLRLTGGHDEARRPRVPVPLRALVILPGTMLVAAVVTAGARVAAPLLMIALSAAALALQTTGAHRITELAGATSTGRRDDHVWSRIGSMPTLVAGAVTGAAVVAAVPDTAPLISAAAALAAIVLVRRTGLLAAYQ